MNEIVLKPSYWASVSGGKDSLYMLNLILHNLDKYPLDGVVHFELEIDYPWVNDVIELMENACKKAGIKFLRIKPRVSWYELLAKKGFPGRTVRWCNSDYKLDSKKQLIDILKSQGLQCIHYIGYCADEKKRFEKRKENGITEIYPLVDFNIMEYEILLWARNQPVFNNYYKYNKRAGCMYCPCMNYIELAYLLRYYPEHYKYLIQVISNTEKMVSKKLGREYAVFQSNSKYNVEYIDNIIRTKWLRKLNEYNN